MGKRNKRMEEIKSLIVKSESSRDIPKEFTEPFTNINTLKKIIDKKNYNKDWIVYIDKELAMILKQLKFRNKIAMGDLCSFLLEQFFKDNKEEIDNLFKNKYL